MTDDDFIITVSSQIVLDVFKFHKKCGSYAFSVKCKVTACLYLISDELEKSSHIHVIS